MRRVRDFGRAALFALLAVVFVKLTDPRTGLPVWIVPEQIAAVMPMGTGSRVIFSGGASIAVQESTAEVFRHLTDSGFSRN